MTSNINSCLRFPSFISESFKYLKNSLFTYFSRFRESAAPKSGQDSKTWKWVTKIPDEIGNICCYKLEEQFDPSQGPEALDLFETKNAEIFPAVEPHPAMVELLDPEIEKKKPIETVEMLNEIKLMKVIQMIGYQYLHDQTGHYLYLPEKEVVDSRFEKLREKCPEMRPPRIKSADGIADDLSFIKAYIEGYDALLSKNAEAVHDHILHLLRMLKLLLTDPHYDEKRAKLGKMVSEAYEKIVRTMKIIEEGAPGMDPEQVQFLQSQLPKIITTLGIAVDNFWAFRSAEEMEAFANRSEFFDADHSEFIEVWKTSHWSNFGEKKFGEKVDPELLKKAWKQMSLLTEKAS